MSDPLIRNISDTALWVAMYRALESERPDALFRDPFARKLAGERGQQILDSIPDRHRHSWAYSMRTYLFDQFLQKQIEDGADMVINLAAGLDARPYRMQLPAGLQWIEVDLPDLIAYKQAILADAKPACRLERVALDLADVAARRVLFARLAARARKAVILSEGLIIYLEPEEVATLARDLAAQSSFQRWITDLASPGLRRMIEKQVGKQLEGAGAPLKFAPPEGPPIFEKYGWRVLDIEPTLQAAARLRRVGFFFRLVAKLPVSKGAQGSQPWSATILLGK
jgi:methyltransferase (TIGR00027 family)